MAVKAYSNPPWISHHDWFNEMATDTMNGNTNGHVHDEKNNVGGIAPGLVGDYIDPHLKTQREYESEYAKLALGGGHKGLLSMSGSAGEVEVAAISTTDEYKRQKGCHNLSDYNKIAHQGGHKDLLKIADNGQENTTPAKTKKEPARQCGDWYNGNNNNNQSPPHKPISPRDTAPIRDQRKSNGNCIVPGGPEEAPRYGKKRFENTSKRHEAPFATNF